MRSPRSRDAARSQPRLHRTKAEHWLRLACAGVFNGIALAAPATALAQAGGTTTLRQFDIPAGPLQAALDRFVADSGASLSVDPALTANRQSAGLRGAFTVPDALARLLAGSGLEAVAQAGGSYALRAQ